MACFRLVLFIPRAYIPVPPVTSTCLPYRADFRLPNHITVADGKDMCEDTCVVYILMSAFVIVCLMERYTCCEIPTLNILLGTTWNTSHLLTLFCRSNVTLVPSAQQNIHHCRLCQCARVTQFVLLCIVQMHSGAPASHTSKKHTHQLTNTHTHTTTHTSRAAIFRNTRRIIFPLRVLGSAGAQWMTSGAANAPISSRTCCTNSFWSWAVYCTPCGLCVSIHTYMSVVCLSVVAVWMQPMHGVVCMVWCACVVCMCVFS